MVDRPQSDEIDLETFLRTAGQSFTDAQKALVPGLDVSVNMMLSNAELELKVAVASDASGKMSIRPISSADLARGDIDPALVSTLRISFVSSIGDVKAGTQLPHTGEGTPGMTTVPVVVGLTLEEAVKLLKSGGWQFEPHAATRVELSALGKESKGRVVRQQPPGGQPAAKKETIVHFWADLGSMPVTEIDGIGEKLAGSLSTIGVTTVGELGLAAVPEVAAALSISETRARSFVDMAGLMSRLAVLGFSDEVVEVLVLGAGIRSIEQLADADPAELHTQLQEAVKSGKVRVPRAFRFTLDEVKLWTAKARSYLGS